MGKPQTPSRDETKTFFLPSGDGSSSLPETDIYTLWDVSTANLSPASGLGRTCPRESLRFDLGAPLRVRPSRPSRWFSAGRKNRTQVSAPAKLVVLVVVSGNTHFSGLRQQQLSASGRLAGFFTGTFNGENSLRKTLPGPIVTEQSAGTPTLGLHYIYRKKYRYRDHSMCDMHIAKRCNIFFA